MAQTSSSCPSFSPMNDVPQEVLLIILKHVRNISSPSSFVSCLLGCRRWYDLGLPLLHSVIVLRNSNFVSFLTRFSHANCVFVKSLTVKINPECPKSDSAGKYVEVQENMNRHGSSESKALWDRLQRLATVISKMSTLLIFSFIVMRNDQYFPGFWMPTSIIASMIESLSKNCVNLEIDTAGEDFSRSDSVHICDKIRDVLPRLQHFRVRLYRLCPAMFCAKVNGNGVIEDHSTTSSARSLKTLIINCGMHNYIHPWAYTARICGDLGEIRSCLDRYVRSEARRSLVTALRDLSLRGNYPEIERLWLFDMQQPTTAPSKYEAYNRRDIILDKTWVMPCFRVLPNTSGRCWWRENMLMRTPEGHDGLSSRWGVDNLAEAQTWQETFSGCRMPAVMIASDHFQREDCWAKPLPIESEEAFKAQCPENSCNLWWNEELTGQRLLYPFEIQGLIDTSPVNEITPSGWRRNGGELEPQR